MALKKRLREFLMFEGLIYHVPDPVAAVDAWYARHPEHAESTEEKSWEQWKATDLPKLLPEDE